MDIGFGEVDVEAIKFQGVSKLANALTEVFTEGVEFSRELVGESFNDVSGEILTNTKRKIAPAMAKVITEHTGISINAIEVLKPDSKATFSTYVYFGQGEAGLVLAQDAVDAFSNVASTLPKSFTRASDPKTALKIVSNSFNKNSGTVCNYPLGVDNNKISLSIEIVFDTYAAFMLSWEKNATPLTPVEITAIILHEIGHALSSVEHAGELGRTLDSVIRYSDGYLEGTPEERIDKLINMSEAVASVADKQTLKHVDATTTTLKFVRDNTSKIAGEFAGTIYAIIAAITQVMLMLITFVAVKAYVISNDIVGLITKYTKNPERRPMSSFRSNKSDVLLAERYADEYVVRHGLANELMSGLDKLIGLPTFTRSDLGRTSSVAHATLVLQELTLRGISGFYHPMFSIYTNRLDNISKDLLKVFNNGNLPPVLRKHYVDSYTRLKKQREINIKNSKRLRIVAIIDKVISSFNISGILKQLVFGTAGAKYAKYMEDLEYLSKNELGYNSARLHELANKAN